MSGAELAHLRPQVEALKKISEEQGASLSSLDRRIEEAIATVTSTQDTNQKAGVQLRGFAVEVGELIHKGNSLMTAIGIVLDELDRLVPIAMSPPPANDHTPAPSVPNMTAPRKGGRT